MAKRIQPTTAEITRWCEALRSEKYKQTSKCLQDMNGYCCLGVACEIFIPQEKRTYIPHVLIKPTLSGSMPKSQKNAPRWLKIVNRLFKKKTKHCLAELNDNLYPPAIVGLSKEQYSEKEPFTFDEIADLLEAVYIHKVLDKPKKKLKK